MAVAPTTLTQDTARRPGALTSSFVIVPCPWPSASVAPTGPLRLTRKVSFGSTVVSPLTTTAIVLLVWPAAKVRLPVWAT